MGDEPKERAVRMHILQDEKGTIYEAVESRYVGLKQFTSQYKPGVFLPMSLYERAREKLNEVARDEYDSKATEDLLKELEIDE